MVVKIIKCQSKKHMIGGCGDPRCPEGLSIKQAMEDAIQANSFNDFFTAKELQNLQPTGVYSDRGWLNLWVIEPDTQTTAVARIRGKSEQAVQYVKNIDKTIIPSFKTMENMQEYIQNLYGKEYVYYDLRKYDNENNLGYDRISVSQITVDAKVQGLGISNHLKEMLCKYADEHNTLLSGTPTNAGDGSIDQSSPEWRENALQHRNRLERSYQKFGYIKNVCAWSVYAQVDYITKEPIEYDYEAREQYSEQGQQVLSGAGAWVRFPNKIIPDVFLAEKA